MCILHSVLNVTPIKRLVHLKIPIQQFPGLYGNIFEMFCTACISFMEFILTKNYEKKIVK